MVNVKGPNILLYSGCLLGGSMYCVTFQGVAWNMACQKLTTTDRNLEEGGKNWGKVKS